MEISKRDYFAAKALTGLLAHEGGGDGVTDPDALAAKAFDYADAMLKLSRTLLDPVALDPAELAGEKHSPKEPSTEALI